ncbi:mechanosensitive ion channel domain-containing protein [Reichenbachiella versicolor]|uniref:mechanosensitive ion channel domain-containing protein n=1 Tax=Reichenbachiella versicolor TaxID=1821036 RepID=UPI000D6E456A|nr:mechanosensitive ion channel domain-containing protein [Reichenbachiella versicolor]
MILEEYYKNIILTTAVWLVYFVIRYAIRSSVKAFGKRQNLAHLRIMHVSKVFIVFVLILVLVSTGVIWNISLEGLSLYITSFFTIAGIGLFASWSILSNITAAVILFFYFPYKIGDRIKILDGDQTLEGTINDMTLFTIIITTLKEEVVVIPNNVILSKSTVRFD